MNVEEYAKALGRSPRRVRDMIATGKLAAQRDGHAWTHVSPQVGDSTTKRKHLIIPDCQVKDGVPLEHLTWVGKYIADKRPDVIINIGDFADMPSLSSYDRGKKSFEGRRYRKDLDAVHRGMELLMEPIFACQGYDPERLLTLGNHEDRITRAVNEDPKLDGTIGLEQLEYIENGWDVAPYLEIRNIDGVAYSHFFTTGVMGRPVSSAAALLREVAGSAVMGHVQYTDLAIHKKTGKTAIFAGTCYQHDEDYLGAQGNAQRRQVVVLHEVQNGIFDVMFVSLDFLKRRYA